MGAEEGAEKGGGGIAGRGGVEGEESARGGVGAVMERRGGEEGDSGGGFFGVEAEGAEGGIPIGALDGFVESSAGGGGHGGFVFVRGVVDIEEGVV